MKTNAFRYKKIHYGWIICVTACLVLMCTNGMPLNGFSPFLPLLADAGYTGSLLSSLVTIRCVSSFIALFFVTFFYRKVSLRTGLSFCCALIGGSFLLMSTAKHFYVYVIGVILNGIAYGLGTMVPVSILMNRWFTMKKATALAISSAGSAVCGMIFPMIIADLAERYSVGAAFRVMGYIGFAVALLAGILLRSSPEEKGLLPFGSSRAAENNISHNEKSKTPLNRKEMILFSFAALLLGGFTMASNSHCVILFTSSGYAQEAASLAFSLLGFMLVIGKCLFGIIADKLGSYKASILFLSVLFSGCLFCTLCPWGAFFMFGGALLMGIGYPPTSLGLPLWTGEITSKEEYAGALKKFQTMHALGGILLSSLPGWFYDLTGNYTSGYAVLCLVILGFSLIYFLIFRRRDQKA